VDAGRPPTASPDLVEVTGHAARGTPTAVPDDATQQLVAERYRLERLLGAGGMGQVWAAEDTLLHRQVAVKAVDLTSARSANRDELRARVLREARAAARIDHPSCVQVYDVVDQDEHVHLVMELVEASTLKEEVLRHGPLDPRAAARMGLELLGALSAAHAAGIVHRDVKPNNVLVLDDGRVKLADFGIASVKDDPNLTSTGMVLGTPTYMSPEAARGERAEAPADLWGLGALLYFAVEGVPPFDRSEALPTLNAVLHEEPRPMQRAEGLASVIRSLLAKSPDARPSAPEVRRLLEAVAAGDAPTVAVPVDRTAVLAATPAPEVVERYERAPRQTTPGPVRRPPQPTRSDSKWMAALVAVVAVAVLAGVGIALARGDDDGGTAAPETTDPTDTGAAGEAEDTTTSETTESTEASTTTDTTAAPSDGTFEGPNFTIELPDGWREVGRAGANGVRFEGPEGSLLVDSVSPPSGDPVAAWERQEEAFRAEHPSYERIRLEETDYRDYDAAIWEYTYEGLRADNLGFVVGDTGYALNFVTSRGAWEDSAGVRQTFRDSFEPA
jgi:hypothetical protein